MTIESINRTYVGFSNVVLTRLKDFTVLNLPKPGNIVLDPGIQIKEQNSRDELGRMTRARTFSVGAMATSQITFNHMQPELISLRVGQQFAVGSFDIIQPKSMRITKGQFPAVATGYMGFGVTADVEAKASVTRLKLSTPMVRMPFAGYETWRETPDCFGIGASLALAFSDNLVDTQEVVAVTIPATVLGRKLSDILVGDHQINCMMVDTEGMVGFLEIYTATPNLSQAAIDLTADTIQLDMFVNAPPGECGSWNIIDTDFRVNCL